MRSFNFEASRAMVMKTCSFESTKPYLFGYYFEDSMIALSTLFYLRVAIMAPHTMNLSATVSRSELPLTKVSDIVPFDIYR